MVSEDNFSGLDWLLSSTTLAWMTQVPGSTFPLSIVHCPWASGAAVNVRVLESVMSIRRTVTMEEVGDSSVTKPVMCADVLSQSWTWVWARSITGVRSTV